MQWRINAETLDAQGNARPSGGTLARFDLPAGPGVRVDTHGYAGLAPSPHYDTLLAKLIVHSSSPRFADALRRSLRALEECRIDGIATNLALLRAIARAARVRDAGRCTRASSKRIWPICSAAAHIERAHGASRRCTRATPAASHEDDDGLVIKAPMPAQLVQFEVEVGDVLPAGAQLGVLEAMKMEHLLHAPAAGRVRRAAGRARRLPGRRASRWCGSKPWTRRPSQREAQAEHDLDAIRPDLQKVIDRHAPTLDANRAAAVAKRHAQGGRTARANIADLCELADDPATSPSTARSPSPRRRAAARWKT